MTIKVVSHQQAVAIKQQNQKLEQELLLTPMPTLTADAIRNQVFNNPALQLTNWAFELGQKRAEWLKRQQQAINQQQKVITKQQDDEYTPG